MMTTRIAALGAMCIALVGCGSSNVFCNDPMNSDCTESSWPGVMTPSPSCGSGTTTVMSCPVGATNTCTFTDRTSYPSPVTTIINYYTGANIANAMTSCSNRLGAAFK